MNTQIPIAIVACVSIVEFFIMKGIERENPWWYLIYLVIVNAAFIAWITCIGPRLLG